MELHAFLQPDDNYAPYAGVAVTSIFENNKHFDEIHIYIVTLSMNEQNRNKYMSLAQRYGRKISFIDVEDIVAYFKEHNMPTYGGSYATYVKLFCLSKFDPNIDRVIYIDADMIIEGKLDGLVTCDMGIAPCAMAVDRTCDFYKTSIGMEKDDLYFNAGLIVFNMYEWRKQQCEQQLREHIEKVRAIYPFCDQDLMNILFSRQTYKLPLKYNYNTDIVLYKEPWYYCAIYDTPNNYYTLEELKEAGNDVVVYHCFESIAARPWVKDSSFPNPKKELWDNYLAKSEWKDFEGVTKEFPTYIKLQTVGYRVLPKKIYAFLCRKFLHKRMQARLDG